MHAVARSGTPRASSIALAAAALLWLGSCGPSGQHRALHWVATCAVPRFDPDGPPDDVRWAIERLLSQGLTRERADGRMEGAAAERFEESHDHLSWTFHLRKDLRFTDGRPCTSADFRAALIAGLDRDDHRTRAALLAAVRGVMPARRTRTRTHPPLGIETPDARTLVLRLDHPDSLLPLELSIPGVSTPWRSRVSGGWSAAVGIGPYRVADASHAAYLAFARARGTSGSGAGGPIPDSIGVHFVIGLARLRSILRGPGVDVVWPLPPDLLGPAPPVGYRLETLVARPRRMLLLVLRADSEPTWHAAARQALAHGVNRAEVLADLGPSATPAGELVPGAGAFDVPRYDASEVATWMSKGQLGRSFRATLLFDADRSGSVVARGMQGTWARQNLYIELEGLRGSDYSHAALTGHEGLLLAEWQPLEAGVAFAAASFVAGPRLAPAGAFRTGWRPPEWSAARAGGASGRRATAAGLEALLERDLVVIPLADLPWVWLEREGGPVAAFHPHFGPDFGSGSGTRAAASRTSGGR